MVPKLLWRVVCWFLSLVALTACASPPLAGTPEQRLAALVEMQPAELQGRRQEVSQVLEALEAVTDRQGHLPHFVGWVRQQLGDESADLTAWQAGIREFLVEREDPRRVLEAMEAYRERRLSFDQVPQAYHQIAEGLFRKERGHALIDGIVGQVVDVRALKGKTVADVGAGGGQASVRLVDHVGPGGKVIAVEVDTSLRRLQRTMANHDARFARIDFRIVDPAEWSPGLAPGEVDLLLLLEVHILGYDASRREQLQWVEAARRSLRPGGMLVVYEGGDATPPAHKIREVLEQGGFQAEVHAVPPQPPGIGENAFLVVARPR